MTYEQFCYWLKGYMHEDYDHLDMVLINKNLHEAINLEKLKESQYDLFKSSTSTYTTTNNNPSE